MFHKVYVNYEDIVKNEPVVIDYLMKNSDCFSVLTIVKKPYSQYPPVFDYSEQLQPFIKNYIYDRKKWLVNFLGYLKHQIMVVCYCCRESRKQLLKMPNLFLAIDNNLPEDICFYRKGKLWFATISHEKIAFMADAGKEDIAFFESSSIKLC